MAYFSPQVMLDLLRWIVVFENEGSGSIKQAQATTRSSP